MGSARDDACLRPLVDDIRRENPHLARVIMRGTRWPDSRFVSGACLLALSLLFVVIGGGPALLAAILSDVGATVLLRPYICHARPVRAR